MVLHVNGEIVTELPSTTEKLYELYPTLQESASKFVTLPVKDAPRNHSLYIGQKEFGVLPGSDQTINLIGSDDATTCHIGVIKHPKGSVAVAHFDGSKSETNSIETMIKRLCQNDGNSNTFLLTIVGGYVPPQNTTSPVRNQSEELSIKLLQYFMTSQHTFNVELWCTCRQNTKIGANGPQPIIYGIGYEKSSGEVLPYHFSSHDPDMAIRSAYRTVANSMVELYNGKNKTITIYPFPGYHSSYFMKLMRLSDEVLLRDFSTSPEVEPPHFCQELRETFKIFINHPEPYVTLFKQGYPREYFINSQGLWELKQSC